MTRATTNKILAMSGGLTCLTGLFLMVHYQSHFSIVIHNIAGLVFMIFSLYHAKLNFKGIASAFTKNSSRFLMAFLFIGCAVIAALRGNFVPIH